MVWSIFSFLAADNCTAVFHSLDVWHKSKSIRKCLAKVNNSLAMLYTEAVFSLKEISS